MIATLRSLLAVLACWLALPALAAFTDNGDGTITDTVTGLMWDKCAWGQTGNDCSGGSASFHNWAAALNVAITANGSSHRNHSDWRLPNRTELESLVKIDASSPAIDTTAFPNTPSAEFRTSTTYAPDSAYAWSVYFYNGGTSALHKTLTGRVRLVRSGQLFGSFDSLTHTTAPVLSSVGVSGTTTTATTLAATSDEAATGYWIVVARDATAPSSAEVKAGANYGAVTQLASGNAAMLAAIEKTFSVTGLTAGTDYDLYFVAEDGSGNLSATPTKVQFATTAVDTIPDVFSFTAQTGVALSAVSTSNSITVAGINEPSAISITGGTYSVNSGAYTAAAGTVNSGDTVTVRQTASGSVNTTTTATLSIGGVSGAFTVTTRLPVRTYSAPSPGGGGTIAASFAGGNASCEFASSSFDTATPPDGIQLPHGVFNFTTTDCGAGATLNFTITYPQDLPAGTRYYKYGPEFGGSAVPHWYVLPGAVVSGNQITFSVTDNGQGDSNATAGVITDPGGPGALPASIPTLSEWGLMLLSLGVAVAALEARRREGLPLAR